MWRPFDRATSEPRDGLWSAAVEGWVERPQEPIQGDALMKFDIFSQKIKSFELFYSVL